MKSLICSFIMLAPAIAAMTPAQARGDVLVLDDAMTSPDTCTGTCPGGRSVTDGFFDAEGWHQSTYDAQVVYDLGPEGVDCGVMEVDLGNFDPRVQIRENPDPENPGYGIDEYHFIFRLDEHPGGMRCDAPDPDASSISPLALRRDPNSDEHKDMKLRLDAWADCWGGRNTYTDPEIEWDIARTYHVVLTWSFIGSSLAVMENGVSLASSSVNFWWPPGSTDPTMNLRYLFVGKDNYHGGQPMQGPVWSNLTVTSVDCPGEDPVCGDRCPHEFCTECPSGCGPCAVVCGDSVCGGGETCATCPGDCGGCLEDEAEELQEQERDEEPTPDGEIPAPEFAIEPDRPDSVSDSGSDAGPFSNSVEGGCSCGLVH